MRLNRRTFLGALVAILAAPLVTKRPVEITTTWWSKVDADGVWRFNMTNQSVDAEVLEGRVEYLAVYDTVLTEDEIKAMAAGLSPLAVRPDKLMHYSGGAS